MHFNFVCIEGNIGIGKTTLVKKLAAHFKAETLFEEFDENPWLPLFYKNPIETALALEVSFLSDRSRQLLKLKKGQKLFSDYSLDKCLIFTKINLRTTEFNQYKKLHSTVSKNVWSPDLVIIIHSNTDNLLRNIKQRNRSYETTIEKAYLEKLNRLYKKFFTNDKPYHILNIFTEDLSVRNYEKMFSEIVSFLKQKPVSKISNMKL